MLQLRIFEFDHYAFKIYFKWKNNKKNKPFSLKEIQKADSQDDISSQDTSQDAPSQGLSQSRDEGEIDESRDDGEILDSSEDERDKGMRSRSGRRLVLLFFVCFHFFVISGCDTYI